MAGDQQPDNHGVVHYEGGIPVFNKRLNDLEDEARKAKERDEKYKDEQLKLNRRLVGFTGVLAAVGILGGAISAYQTHIAGINAYAAQKNAASAEANAQSAKAQAEASRQTVEEMKKSGLDTHELAVQAKNQTAATESADRLAAQALHSVQRAFVLPGSIDPMIFDEAKGIQFLVHWDNSGTTPASGTWHVNYLYGPRPLPDNFPFPDTWEEGAPHINTPFVLGPKGSGGVIVGPVPAYVINGLLAKPTAFHLNLWGWAKYQDVFKIEHLSEFCDELFPIDSGPVKGRPDLTAMRYRVDACPRHNCYDDECKAQR